MDAPPVSEGRPQPRGNGMGIAGFVVSLVGLLTCGILSPLGLVFSLLGLRRQPKGLAIAGTVISVLGVGALVVVVLSWSLVVGLVETGTVSVEAIQRIHNHRAEHGELPDTEEGNALLEDLEDGWGHPLRYERTTDGFVVSSPGPDGEFGTEDDFRQAQGG